MKDIFFEKNFSLKKNKKNLLNFLKANTNIDSELR